MKNLVRRFWHNRLTRYSFVTGVGLIFNMVMNAILYVFLLRYLSLSTYGVYTSLFASVSYLTFLAPGLSLYFVKLGVLVKHGITGAYVFKKLYLFSGLALIVIAFSYLIFDYISGKVVPKEYNWFVLLLGILTLLSPMVEGLLRGMGQFTFLSITTIVNAFLKAGVIFVIVHWSLAFPYLLLGLLLMITFVFLGQLSMVCILLRKFPKKERMRVFPAPPQFWRLVLIAFLLMSFINIDLLFARRFLSEHQAGFYAAEVNVARGILIVSAAVVPVMFSLSSEAYLTGETNRRHREALGFTIVTNSIGVVLLYLFSGVLFSYMLQKPVAPRENWTWVLALAMSFYSFTDVIGHYLVSIDRTRIIVSLSLLAILQGVLYMRFHHGLMEFAIVAIMFHILGFLVSLAHLHPEWILVLRKPLNFVSRRIALG